MFGGLTIVFAINDFRAPREEHVAIIIPFFCMASSTLKTDISENAY